MSKENIWTLILKTDKTFEKAFCLVEMTVKVQSQQAKDFKRVFSNHKSKNLFALPDKSIVSCNFNF
jgi:hypothetical protein